MWPDAFLISKNEKRLIPRKQFAWLSYTSCLCAFGSLLSSTLYGAENRTIYWDGSMTEQRWWFGWIRLSSTPLPKLRLSLSKLTRALQDHCALPPPSLKLQYSKVRSFHVGIFSNRPILTTPPLFVQPLDTEDNRWLSPFSFSAEDSEMHHGYLFSQFSCNYRNWYHDQS